MNKYKVSGLYTISFEMEVEAESSAEAEQEGYDLCIQTEWNGNSVFCDEARLEAVGYPMEIEVELIEGEEDE